MAASGYGVTLLERDPPRRRHRAAAMGHRRDVVLLVHHPAPDHRARLRLVAAWRLLLLRARERSRPACASTSCRCGKRHRQVSRWPCLGVLGVSIVRRKAGVSGQQEEFDRRSERVAAMTGIERTVVTAAPTGRVGRHEVPSSRRCSTSCRSSSDRSGVFAAALDAGGNAAVALGLAPWSAQRSSARSPTRCCSAIGTSCSRACPRRLLNEMVDAVQVTWPVEMLRCCCPMGMVAVITGGVDDGWGGVLGWFWARVPSPPSSSSSSPGRRSANATTPR